MFDFLRKKLQTQQEMVPFVVTKKTKMGEMLEYDMGLASVLMASGMSCVGCPSSTHESLETACQVHGLDVDDVLERINRYMERNSI